MLHNHLDMFKKRENIVEIEEGKLLSPKFDNDGLIPVITMCSKTKDILMHGYMNVEAFKKTIETKEAHYFSRSRQQIWHKGKTSGFTQKVTEIRIDDDQDSVWLTVDIGDGFGCHVGDLLVTCFLLVGGLVAKWDQGPKNLEKGTPKTKQKYSIFGIILCLLADGF